MRYLSRAHVDEVYAKPRIGRLLLSNCIHPYVKHVFPLEAPELSSGACLLTQNTNCHMVLTLRTTHPQLKSSLSNDPGGPVERQRFVPCAMFLLTAEPTSLLNHHLNCQKKPKSAHFEADFL
jgi:hypothetical protein